MSGAPLRLRLAGGYSLLLGAWWCAWQLVGDSLWWLALVNHAAAWGALPLPFLLALAWRPPRLALLCRLAPAAAVATLVFGPLLIPGGLTGPARQQGAARVLRVMTYNVLYSNPSPQAVAETILSADPDIVALQEVQPEQMRALVGLLGRELPYHAMAPPHPYGTPALFSRWPIAASRIVDLRADRQAVLARVRHPAAPLTVVSAHLLAYGLEWAPWQHLPEVVRLRVDEQNRQARLLLAAAAAERTDAVVVACDCNSPETAGTARIMHGALLSSARAAGPSLAALTRPGRAPDVSPAHIDYIFFRGRLRALDHYLLLADGGSDHRPVVAELALAP